MGSGQGRGEAGSEAGEVVSPPPSPLRTGSEAPTLPSKKDGAVKKGQSLPAVVYLNPSPSEAGGRSTLENLLLREEAANKKGLALLPVSLPVLVRANIK